MSKPSVYYSAHYEYVFLCKRFIEKGSIYFQLYDCLRISEEEKGKEVGVEPITVKKYGKGEPEYARGVVLTQAAGREWGWEK